MFLSSQKRFKRYSVITVKLIFLDALEAAHLFELSRNFASIDEVRRVGFAILPDDPTAVDRILHQSEIVNAGYQILNEFRKRFESPDKAYEVLLQSLEKKDMNQLATCLKEIVEGKKDAKSKDTTGKSFSCSQFKVHKETMSDKNVEIVYYFVGTSFRTSFR